MANRDIDVDSDDFTISSATEPDVSNLASSPEHVGGVPHNERKRSRRHSGGNIVAMGDKKHVMHELQMARIELSQKTMALDNLKTESRAKEEELQERLQDVLQQKQLLQTQLESELRVQREESRRRQDKMQEELRIALSRQRSLEEAHTQLGLRTADLKRLLGSSAEIVLDEEQYIQLKARTESELSLKEFLVLRIYEITSPLKMEVNNLGENVSVLEADRAVLSSESERAHNMLDRERELHMALQTSHQDCLTQLEDIKAKVQHGNYKIENFTRISDERDTLSSVVSDLREQIAFLETTRASLIREKEEFHKECVALKQSNNIMSQDKEYLNKQVCELSSRAAFAEERLQSMTRQLDDAKAAREELFEKHIASRDAAKAQFDCKLNEEISAQRAKTDQETDRIKTSLRELYERENRTLTDQRDAAISERDRLASELRDLQTSMDHLRQEVADSRILYGTRESELLCQGRLREAESERSSLLTEAMGARVRRAELELEKIQSKHDTLTKEYYQLEASSNRRIGELEGLLGETQSRLSTYEGLEQELDTAVMQAAQISSTANGDSEGLQVAERTLMAYGGAARLPAESKRRMQQSVELARKVIHLEKRCKELMDSLHVTEAKNKELQDEVMRVNGILSEAQQPYSYLVDSLRSRDALLSTHKAEVARLTKELEQVRKERNSMAKIKNTMATDLERLLAHREEVTLLRRLFENMQNSHISSALVKSGEKRKDDKSAVTSLEFQKPTAEVTKQWHSSLRAGPSSQIDVESDSKIKGSQRKEYGIYWS